jgi:hypothetical protein
MGSIYAVCECPKGYHQIQLAVAVQNAGILKYRSIYIVRPDRRGKRKAQE